MKKRIFFIIFLIVMGATVSAEIIDINTWDNYGNYGYLNHRINGSSIVSNSTTPNPNKVLQFYFPVGFGDAGEPAKVWYVSSKEHSQIYIQYYFKYSSNWQWNGVADKHWYIYTSKRQESFIITIRGSKHEMALSFGGRAVNYIAYGYTFVPGKWYKVKHYLKMNSPKGASNGIWKLWVNDNLIYTKSDLNYLRDTTSDNGMNAFDFVPVFGGSKEQKNHDDYLWLDYTIISTTDPGGDGVGEKKPSPANSLVIK